MYYNRITGILVIDYLDWFLMAAILGSVSAPRLKLYLSEKKAMERLKYSIMKKSKFRRQSYRSISNSKKIERIYRLALDNRGGQLEEFQVELSNKSFKLAQQIKGLVEQLAHFLKDRELKGVAKIFFKAGRLILELILYKCQINVSYSVLTEVLSTRVIVITATAGGAVGFTLSWFAVGASLAIAPTLISILLLRNVAQQIANQKDYTEFQRLVNQMLDNPELKQTIQALFVEVDVPKTPAIEMKPWGSNKAPLTEFTFDADQSYDYDEFIKARMKQELGLIENPSSDQLEKIIHFRKARNSKVGKTVYFREFIKRGAEDPDNSIEAEIVNEAIKVRNKEL